LVNVIFKAKGHENAYIKVALTDSLIDYLHTNRGVAIIEDTTFLETISYNEHTLQARWDQIFSNNLNFNNPLDSTLSFLRNCHRNQPPTATSLMNFLAYFYNGIFSDLESLGRALLQNNLEFSKIEVKIIDDYPALYKIFNNMGTNELTCTLRYTTVVYKDKKLSDKFILMPTRT
jgi:hypothetical protein